MTLAAKQDEATKRIIIAALQKYGWHMARTAEALGVQRTTLYCYMKRLGICDNRADYESALS